MKFQMMFPRSQGFAARTAAPMQFLRKPRHSANLIDYAVLCNNKDVYNIAEKCNSVQTLRRNFSTEMKLQGEECPSR
jgi:hypothetical protein